MANVQQRQVAGAVQLVAGQTSAAQALLQVQDTVAPNSLQCRTLPEKDLGLLPEVSLFGETTFGVA